MDDKLSKFHIKGNNKDDAPIFTQHFIIVICFPVSSQNTENITAPLMIKSTMDSRTMTIPFGIHSVHSIL